VLQKKGSAKISWRSTLGRWFRAKKLVIVDHVHIFFTTRNLPATKYKFAACL
jgi:hypothetical protein